MALKYTSGEEIREGDQVLYHFEPGRVEFVSEPGHGETGKFFDQFGGGVMILAPSFGRVFDQPGEDLEFVSRSDAPLR